MNRRVTATVAVVLLFVATLVPIGQAFGDEPADAIPSQTDRGAAAGRDVDDEIVQLHWRLGVVARDQQNAPILAAHHFYRAAQTAHHAGEKSRAQSYLIAAQHQATASDRCFIHPVHKATFSADGRRIVTSGRGKTAWLWNVRQAQPIQGLKHDGPVNGAVFNSASTRLLTWSEDHSARLWNAIDGARVHTFRHDKPVNRATFSNNSGLILTSSGTTARLWSVMNPDDPVHTLRHQATITSAVFSADDGLVLTSANDTTARLWDAKTGRLLHTFAHGVVDLDGVDDTSVSAAIFMDDEKLVLTAGMFGVWAWDADTGKVVRKLRGRSPVVSADGLHWLTWSGKQARLWHVRRDEPLRTFKADLDFHGAVLSTGGTEEKPVALRFVTWNYDAYYGRSAHGRAYLWNADHDKPIQTYLHDDYVHGAALIRDEKFVLTYSRDGSARLWDVEQKQAPQIMRHRHAVEHALLAPGGDSLLAWTRDGAARLWGLADKSTNAPLRTFENEGHPLSAKLSADGSRVVAYSTYGDTIRLWDVERQKPLRTFRLPVDVDGVALSRDAKRLFVFADDYGAWIWDVDKTEPLLTINKKKWFSHPLFNADGTRLFVRSGEQAWLLDVERGRVLETFEQKHRAQQAVFSGDSIRVLSWHNFDKLVQLWDPRREQPLRTLRLKRSVKGAVMNADATRVLAWTSTPGVELWDMTEADAPPRRFHDPLMISGKTSSVSRAVFSPDGQRFLLGLGAAGAQLWDIDGSEPLRTFDIVGSARVGVFTADSSRIFTGTNGPVFQMWDIHHSEPLRTFRHTAGSHGGVPKISNDGGRVLTLGGRKGLLWNAAADPRPIALQIREHQLRTATRLDEDGRLRVLSAEQWRDLADEQAVNRAN